VDGTARSVVDAVIYVIVVVRLMIPTSKASPITMSAIGKVVSIAKMTKVSIKIVVEMAEEENRCKAHVKR
jgi:hypothetical protein